MLKPYKLADYQDQFQPEWAFIAAEDCLPDEVLVPYNHFFCRLARQASVYDSEDFVSCAEKDPNRNWGEQLPLALGLSVIENETKARKYLKLPYFRQFKGIISLDLFPADGVVKQTGIHGTHYTWWRTKSFDMSNLKMLQL